MDKLGFANPSNFFKIGALMVVELMKSLLSVSMLKWTHRIFLIFFSLKFNDMRHKSHFYAFPYLMTL